MIKSCISRSYIRLSPKYIHEIAIGYYEYELWVGQYMEACDLCVYYGSVLEEPWKATRHIAQEP
jgi:hypothetical protein